MGTRVWARIKRDWWVALFILAMIALWGGMLSAIGGEERGWWFMVAGAAVLGCGMLYLFIFEGGHPDAKPTERVVVIDGQIAVVPIEAPAPMPERMNKARYAEYLHSSHWRQTRQRKLDEVGRRCQLCGATHGIEIHHNNYDHLGAERMSDLIALCSGCHRHFHQGRKVR
jgi:hypothetical protein